MKPIALAIALFLGSSWAAWSQVVNLAMHQLTPANYNPVSILTTANQLIAAGEATASRCLLDFNPGTQYTGDSSRHEYVTWLCVLLYDPKPGASLEPPLFGFPGFPFYQLSSNHPPYNSDWPKFPLLFSSGVPFYFAGGYSLAGQAYPSSYYVRLYHETGVFRTRFYAIPTRGEASRALDELLASDKWRTLDWKKTPRPGEASIADSMRRQVERIPVGWKFWQAY